MTFVANLLRPVADLLNRVVQQKTPARELVAELEGSVIAVRVRNTGLAIAMHIVDGELLLGEDVPDAPDVVVTGNPIALARLAGSAGESLVRSGEVDISGDAVLADRFRKLLRLATPDPEETLAGAIGDAPAHRLGELARAIAAWGRAGSETLAQNVAEYLTEERRVVPRHDEMRSVRTRLDTLTDDVARLEARIRLAESRQPKDGP